MHLFSRSQVKGIVSVLIITSACLAFVFSARPPVQAIGTQISLSPNHGHPTVQQLPE